MRITGDGSVCSVCRLFAGETTAVCLRGKAGANGAGAKRLQIAEESDRHLQKEGATA